MKDAEHVAHHSSLPYGFTGVVDRAWIAAAGVVGRQYTKCEIESGWPLAMEPHRLANMQFPKDSAGQNFASTALLAACKKDQLQCTAFELHDYGLGPDGKWGLVSTWTDYAITAQDFAEWMAQQDEKPSVHIAAWFKAVGVNIRPQTPPEQNATARAIATHISAGSPAGNGRRDLLTPLIEAAQKECESPIDAPAVWASMVQMAEARKRPLLGVSNEGIKWQDANDATQFFTLKHLRDRLYRSKKKSL